MKRYPSIASLLRPGQLLAYRAACWFVSGHQHDRGTGRTFVLATAHLHEIVRGRSTKLWDHADYRPRAWENVVDRHLHPIADKLGFKLEINKDGVITEVEHEDGVDPKTFLDRERDMAKACLAEAVRDAYKAGLTKEEIVVLAVQAVHNEVVDTVHGL